MAEDSRVRIETQGDGVRVHVPAPRARWRAAKLALLAPIVAYAALGNVVLLRTALVSATFETPSAEVGIWAVTIAILLLVDLPLVIALVVVLYQLTGSEVVSATPWMLADERRMLGVLRWRRSWAAMRVTNLRLSPLSGGPAAPHLLGRRGVLFLVDGKRVRGMAEGCTPAEAAEVLAAVDEALHRPTVTR